jgi:hypothetical protein
MDKSDEEARAVLLAGAFEDFIDEFETYCDPREALQILRSCLTFCEMLGFSSPQQCVAVARVTLVLVMCSASPSDVRTCLCFAFANLNKQWRYVADMDSRERSRLAVFHVFIAQANLLDDMVPFTQFHETCFPEEESGTRVRHALFRVVAKWENRLLVKPSVIETASRLFADREKVFN